MTGAKKLVAMAGVAAACVAGVALLGASSAGASPTPPAHNAPAQTHPGQTPPRASTPASTTSTPASAGQGSGHSAGHHAEPPASAHGTPAQPTTGHGHEPAEVPAANAHAEPASSATPDPLAPTYFGTTPDAGTVVQILLDGNARWVNGNVQSPSTDAATRRETALSGQHPFATILTCADSRIPVERVFDRGVGELFVVRVAGNIVAETEAGTIEYGVEHLGTPVVVIMGHTGCGAVAAACEGGEAHGNVRFLIGEITPAVRRAATLHPSAEGAELVAAAVRENVMQSMFDLLATSESVRSAVDRGDVQLVGAIYDLSSGKVEFLGEHPWQDGLISVMNERGAVGAANPRHQMTADAETTGGRAGH